LAGALKVCKSLPGFRSAPGGQLVQESDVSAPVRGARLVLADLEGVRANMSASWLAQMGWDVWVLDGAQADDFNEVGPSPSPVPEPQGPIAWASPAQLAQAVARIPIAQRYVLTCGSSLLARYAATDLARLTGAEVVVLQGGTLAWIEAGLPLEQGETHLASARTDRYRRPYEGTDNPRGAMQGYLDWEYGLVDQLGRDGTHGFHVI